jgi:hypothetical protein
VKGTSAKKLLAERLTRQSSNANIKSKSIDAMPFSLKVIERHAG